MNFRHLFYVLAAGVNLAIAVLSFWNIWITFAFIVTLPLTLLGFIDVMQKGLAVKRNFPVIGHGRYLLLRIRPEIHQYFIEGNSDGKPFSHEQRNLVYNRARNMMDTIPFGTQEDITQPGYEWVNHSIVPIHINEIDKRILIGGPHCKHPYSSSIFNISAMSYGSLSKNAILALNGGARLGSFAHNTGEGSVSPYHLEPGGDLIWQIGTGYFGCRDTQGKFSREAYSAQVADERIKMVEIKLSQGAKPGHGGILPGKKVTPEVARIRGVEPWKTVFSPPSHSAFSTPKGLIDFIATLRDLSGGKPIGFKLCLGKRREFYSICKAMVETGITPDFITVDGGEGGTGAAPLEFSNTMGTPLVEGLIEVTNALVGFGLRDKIKVIAAGKVVSGFNILRMLCLGADLCASARSFMLSLGCIQALQCNTDHCPTGVATQNKSLMHALHVGDKTQRVANYHRHTVSSLFEMLGAMGMRSPSELHRWHLMKRIRINEVRNYSELFPYPDQQSFLLTAPPESYRRVLQSAKSESFSG